jgi:hypothetical protein
MPWRAADGLNGRDLTLRRARRQRHAPRGGALRRRHAVPERQHVRDLLVGELNLDERRHDAAWPADLVPHQIE